MISVVLPTIRGREHLLEQTVAAYQANTPRDVELEFIVSRGHPACGPAWNAGAERASGEYLLLGADDLQPHEGWAAAAIAAENAGAYPAPWIVRRDGSTECCGTLGSGLLLPETARDGLECHSSPIPFMRRSMWPHVGPALPTHYYSDDWVAYKARREGLRIELRRGYKFTHLDGHVGHKPLVARAMTDRQHFAEAVAAL